jgi:hypothetical protein
MNRLMPQLAPGVRRQLNRIKLHYLLLHGESGLYERVNNRTVVEIIAEYVDNDPQPIAAGEADGVRYELYDVPKPEKKHPEADDGANRDP